MNLASVRRKTGSGKMRIFLILVCLVAVGSRLWGLSYPNELVFDESHYVPAARVMVGVSAHPGMGAWAKHPLVGKAPDPAFYHPQLGKFLIGLGILALGDNGWGWRASSVLFGLLSLVFFCRLASRLLKNRSLALLAGVLLSLDYLHVVHSRVAMLDIFITAFSLLGMWAGLEAFESKKSRGAWLAVAGVAFCAAVSVKHYAVLALIAFLVAWGLFHRDGWKSRLLVIGSLGAGVIALYGLWFFYFAAHGYRFVEWLEFLRFSTVALRGPFPAHPYGSSPAGWLWNHRAIWYFYKGSATPRGIVGMGNPAIWFGFAPALCFLAVRWYKKRELVDGFICLWFLMYYVPLFMVLRGRQGFIYYLLPIVPAGILAIVRTGSLLVPNQTWLWRYAGVVFIFTLLFLPFLIGLPVPLGFIHFIQRFFIRV